MVRLACALAAIIILALCAGLANSRPQAAKLIAGASSAADVRGNADAFQADLMLIKRAALLPTTQSSVKQQEPPAPALLVYLGLVLIGSAGSVALARRRLQREG
jgi:hypothetical protein